MDLQKDMVVMLLSMLEGRFALTNHPERNNRNIGLGIEIHYLRGVSEVNCVMVLQKCSSTTFSTK